jgi:Uma2 family endonuclease
MVVCQSSTSDIWEDAPVVVVEVLTEATERTDLVEKRSAYFDIQTLQIYLAVDSRRLRVIVFRRDSMTWVTEHLREVTDVVSLPTIGVEISLAEIYEGTLE